MASSLGIGCGGNNSVVVGRLAAELSIDNRCSLRPLSVKTSDRSCSGRRKARISAAASAVVTTATASKGMKNQMSLETYEGKDQGRGTDAVDAHERLDQWMRESVVEIVKNLKEAPLLVQVYPKKKSDKGARVETANLMTEKKAVVEDWPVVKEKWEAGERPLPEGVIFVEELGGGAPEREGGGEEGREKTTRAWGIVVQGKGVGCGPVCYLLKTSRVGSGPGSGMGLCCTHFCLVKVKTLRETVESQLKNCWLLQSQ